MGEHVRAGELDIYVEQVGEGPDVDAFWREVDASG
jgi:hypothetical protein